MSRPRVLVVTTVHRPDDARIRAKLIPSLARRWDVSYACSEPGPSDPTGLEWLPLRGGRGRRWWEAARLAMSGRWDLVALHDPELLPIGFARAAMARRTVFDLHEHLPDQIRHKDWVPGPLRPALAALARAALRAAERVMTVTVAEAGYVPLFGREPVVIPNHLSVDTLPEPAPDAGYLVYVGDVTRQRGADLALEAAAGADRPLCMIGRVAPSSLADDLRRRAGALGVALELAGPLPHEAALARVASATVGLSPLLDLPNYRHSLPTKVPEYLAAGIPVLVSDLPGTTQPVEGLGGVVVVEPGDPVAWAEAGRKAARDPTLREDAARQVDVVRARFAWDPDAVLAAYDDARSG